MSRQELGTWEPDESRTYRFTVTFVESGTDNAFMGGSLSVGFRWAQR
jgi:hypothetical protein